MIDIFFSLIIQWALLSILLPYTCKDKSFEAKKRKKSRINFSIRGKIANFVPIYCAVSAGDGAAVYQHSSMQ